MLHACIVHAQDFERGRIVDPHRLRIALEQSPKWCLAVPQSCRGATMILLAGQPSVGVGCGGRQDERPMDQRPQPRLIDRVTVVVHRIGDQQTDHAVMQYDEPERYQKWNPVLVYGEQGDKDEEEEVTLDRPAPEVDKERTRSHEAAGCHCGAKSPSTTRLHRHDGARRQDACFGHGVRDSISSDDPEGRQADRGSPEHADDDAMATLPHFLVESTHPWEQAQEVAERPRMTAREMRTRCWHEPLTVP